MKRQANQNAVTFKSVKPHMLSHPHFEKMLLCYHYTCIYLYPIAILAKYMKTLSCQHAYSKSTVLVCMSTVLVLMI